MSTTAPSPGYKADTPIAQLADWLGDPVEPADFPQTTVRFRNDRAAASIGLDGLSDEQWTKHFGRFKALPDNLPQPLALRYHGHQFRNYNPDIGDGRGFLFAQMRDQSGRLLDLGTKGSGQTPWSRHGDGRLTLLGAMREILATEKLEALGVNTSKTLSVIETGEQLDRDDEPSPARSAVMVRLSHGHIRFGSFQRLLALELPEEMEQLTEYCLAQFPGPMPPESAPGREEPAAILLHQVVERMADLAASLMVAGFVHGVLNTDNMNISGECFDYGPWRFLPTWDPSFTAAYFDHAGLYAFGRQPEAIHWNCGQLAVALRAICEAPPLIAALERFGELYMEAVGRRWCWRLGTKSRGVEADTKLVGACEAAMRESKTPPDSFFYNLRMAPDQASTTELAELLADYERTAQSQVEITDTSAHKLLNLFAQDVDAIWAPIASDDDWSLLDNTVSDLRAIGHAHGEPPIPAGHLV